MPVARQCGGAAAGPAGSRFFAAFLPFCRTAVLLTACARVQVPPGGPPDRVAPVLTAIFPDSQLVLPDLDRDVVFQFSEVVSEGGNPNFGLGTGDLEKLILLSPSDFVPRVHWRRNRITVSPREGWRPGLVYRVELLPGVMDLSNNRTADRTVVTFTTGPPLPGGVLRGMVVSWSNRRPVPGGLVEAVLLPDSLSYRTVADSAGRFELGPIPRGEYLVYGVIDQNRDSRHGQREEFDSVRVAAGRDSVGEIWAHRHDSTAARIAITEVRDSLTVGLTFSLTLNPYQRVPADSVRVLLLPDSVPVPILAVLPQAEFDSMFRARVAVDTTPAGRARADSARAAAAARARADSIRADSVARARRAAEIRIPGAERRLAATPDTAGRGPLLTKPALFEKLFIRLGEPLRPGGRYAVVVFGVETLSRVSGSSRAGFAGPAAPRTDTSSVRARPDTGRFR